MDSCPIGNSVCWFANEIGYSTTMASFDLHTEYQPAGDQPRAIQELVQGITAGVKHQVLLGATGTGKTFTIANVVEKIGKPTLVLCHNKTLAAQLFGEFKRLFPNNAVEYFVSYYDYYQPEAYVASSDTYIQKDSQINEVIDKLRHSATRSLLERNDVVIVSSVSCIYGLGSKEAYDDMLVHLALGAEVPREEIIAKLISIQYERNDHDFHRGAFRVRGDVIEVFPAHEESAAVRIEQFGDEVERLSVIAPLTGNVIQRLEKVAIYPASHYVVSQEQMNDAMVRIRDELRLSIAEFKSTGLLLEAQRIEDRTMLDLELIEETGRCAGIENYSRHLAGRDEGDPAPTLLDFFPDDWLLVIDESHVTVPQVRGMYKGDRSRKQNLVKFGFRLKSALDNRPLQFEEFQDLINQVIHVSATPAEYELSAAEGVVVEQIIRPTGLLDPQISVRPVAGQVDDLLEEIRCATELEQRVLVTVLTKRMAQELTSYYDDLGVKVRYLHSDIDTLERVEILRDLRFGEFDVLVGINLLREGLDIPEVALVAVLDADKEGFLRNRTSLLQTIGRAARNVDGRVILYGDRVTKSMKAAIDETDRRRGKQHSYNEANGITPVSIRRSVENPLGALLDGERVLAHIGSDLKETVKVEAIPETVAKLRLEMKAAAASLKFEDAAKLRDQIKQLERLFLAH